MTGAIVFTCVFYALIGFGKAGSNSRQPSEEYFINIGSPLYVCLDDASVSWIDTSDVRVERQNETTAYMSGLLSFLQGLKPNTMLEIWVDKEVSGEYQTQATHEICDFCSEVGNPDGDYFNYFKYIDFPKKCPFEAASYQINNLVVDPKDLPINSANAGFYLVTLNFYRLQNGNCLGLKEFIACLKLDLTIEAK